MCARVGGAAGVVEVFAVAAVGARHKKYCVVARGVFGEFLLAVRHRFAYSVVFVERQLWRCGVQLLADFVGYFVVFVMVHRGLRIEHDVFVKVYGGDLAFVGDYNRRAVHLPYKPYYFGVVFFAVDYCMSVGVRLRVGLDEAVQPQYYRAGGVDDVDVVLDGDLVCGRRLAVRPEEYGGVVHCGKFVVCNGLHTFFFEPRSLLVVVHHFAEAEQPPVCCNLRLRLVDGIGNAKAKPGVRVDVYLHIAKSIT